MSNVTYGIPVTCIGATTASNPPPPPTTPPALTGITLTPSAITIGVGQRQVVTVGFLPAAFTGTVQVNADVTNRTIAVIVSNNAAARTIEIECAEVGTTSLIVSAENTGVSERATITCTALPVNTAPPATPPPTPPPSNTTPPPTSPPPPTAPPSTGPTVQSLIGTYSKQGLRTSGDCRPPLFNAQWEVDLTVDSFADGNHGIRLRERHPGQNSAGPYEVTLSYSQFDVQSSPNGDLLLISGSPTRMIADVEIVTHIEITFKADGSITGTETLTGPGGCREVYLLSGKRR